MGAGELQADDPWTSHMHMVASRSTNEQGIFPFAAFEAVCMNQHCFNFLYLIISPPSVELGLESAS